jgi:SAM-dependent methyltransferase
MTTADKIKEYWEERARENADSPRATTNDVYLRRLELATIIKTMTVLGLPGGSTVLDLGCGDGYTTIEVANALPGLRFLGLDFTAQMIANARRHLSAFRDLQERLAFEVGDVGNLCEVCDNAKYDVVMTDRCLINLPSRESQAHAFAQIAQHVKPGGHYVAIENFVEGQDNMNAMRRAIGLSEIPIRWHNLYFRRAEFTAIAEPFFEQISFEDFSSSYYFATRVIYAAMCKMHGKEPDYEHEIHQRAVGLPSVGQLSPVRLALLRRREKN